jgi:hypothetical protein
MVDGVGDSDIDRPDSDIGCSTVCLVDVVLFFTIRLWLAIPAIQSTNVPNRRQTMHICMISICLLVR